MKVETSLCWELGSRRENEDYVLQMRHEKQAAAVFVAADGVGGYGGGAQASRIAAHTIAEGFLDVLSLRTDVLTGLFFQANEAVRKLQVDGLQMRSTAAALFLLDGALAMGYIGDTRIYRFRNDHILYQSKDHSVPQMAVDAGDLDEQEIRFHPDRNRLLYALGERYCRPCVMQLSPLKAGDAFLLCTDGFWEYVTEPVMLQQLAGASTAQQWIGGLKNYLCAIPTDGHDNYSAIGIMVTEK